MSYPRFRMARRHKFLKVTSGDYTYAGLGSSNVWKNLDTALDLTIPGAVGDTIVVEANGIWDAGAGMGALQAATWDGSALQNWIGSGEPTTTTGDGVMGWFAGGAAQLNIGGSAPYALQAADVVGGAVTIRWRVRMNNTKTLYATPNDPLFLLVENLGPADPH